MPSRCKVAHYVAVAFDTRCLNYLGPKPFSEHMFIFLAAATTKKAKAPKRVDLNNYIVESVEG